MLFKDKIKQWRLLSGLTQQEIADRIHKSRGAYMSYERGNSEPYLTTLLKLSDLYGKSLDELMRDNK